MATFDHDNIRVVGARDHNLKNVSLTLPRNRLICFTGVSGSGKSTMAFDTLFAEGQRRYIESLSSYARQFLGQLPKPDCDQITGLAPSIAIQQKSAGWNPRSTVGTITQINDFLRVLFARAATPHCTQCARPIRAQSREQMLARVLELPAGTRFLLLAPKVRAQKGEYKDLFADLLREGFVRARVDGDVIDLNRPPQLDRYRRHDVEVVVDRLVIRDGVRPRLADALETALRAGGGTAVIAPLDSPQGAETRGDAAEVASASTLAAAAVQSSTRGVSRTNDGVHPTQDILLSSEFACTHCGIGFEPPSPQMLSFNSPQGMCLHCDGLGVRFDFDPDLLVPDPSKRFLDPCVAPLRTRPGRWRRHIYAGVAAHFGFDLDARWRDLPAAARRILLYGAGDAHITFEWRTRHGVWKHGGTFDGVIADLTAKYRKSSSALVRSYYEQFMRHSLCSECRGARLARPALGMRLKGVSPGAPAGHSALNIHEVGEMSIRDAQAFLSSLVLNPVQRVVADEPLKEIRARLAFLLDVGLDYLTLNRGAPTLSGGESQRIRLASQIGCGLVGVLYVLDEPSIGLHPRDNQRLLASLQRLRDIGNTVVVVEHDEETMRAADLIVDFGPGPGARGGRVVAIGDLPQVVANADSLTGDYLSGRREIAVPPARRPVKMPAIARRAAIR